MSPINKCLQSLKKIDNSDPENAHYAADTAILLLLTELGHAKVADAWFKVRQECGGFWYA